MNAGTGEVLLEHVERAANWWERGVGLLGRPASRAGPGLWIVPCRGVHTFGMRFSLDIIVLDSQSRVLAVHWRVRPLRILLPRRGDHSVLEIPSGRLATGAICVGVHLRLEPEP